MKKSPQRFVLLGALLASAAGFAMADDLAVETCPAKAGSKPARAYVGASSAAMREQPSMAGAIMAHLPIGTPLELVCHADGWLKVWSPTFKGAVGWMRADLARGTEPTLEAALRELASASAKNSPAVLSLAERALALGPLDQSAHEAAVRALEHAGERKAAEQASRRLAALRAPAVVRPPGEPQMIFVVDGELISPLARLSNGKLEPYRLSANTDEEKAFADRYFATARAYYFYEQGGASGMALVRRKEEPSCSSLVASYVRVPEPGLPVKAGIATNFPVTQHQAAPEVRPSPAQRDAMAALAREALAPWHLPAADLRRVLGAPNGDDRTGFEISAVPLPGKPHPLLVATSNVEIRTQNGEPSDASFRGYTLVLIAEAGANGHYQITHQNFQRVESEQEFSPRSYLTYLDIDQDGSDELIFSGSGYEWWWYEALGRTKAGWAELVSGGGGGC